MIIEKYFYIALELIFYTFLYTATFINHDKIDFLQLESIFISNKSLSSNKHIINFRE